MNTDGRGFELDEDVLCMGVLNQSVGIRMLPQGGAQIRPFSPLHFRALGALAAEWSMRNHVRR